MNKLLMAGVLVAVLAIGAYGLTSVYAQEEGVIEVTDGFSIDTNQALTVVILGIGAGFLTAYQGYRTTKNDWDTLIFFDGVIKAVLGSIPLAIGSAMTQTNFGVFEYIMVFFAALGIGVTISKSRQNTIPSNAT